MKSKLNHLAIVTDNYTRLSMFYRALFGMKVSGDTDRESQAISVGDGYVGMTLIPRPPGRYAGLDHFGIEVEDLDRVRVDLAEKYPDIEIVKRPGNRPFASYSMHDPAGNYFDLSQMGHENRAEVYEAGNWSQDRYINHFSIRAREHNRLADFYAEIFGLAITNSSNHDEGVYLTDGRVTLGVLPWKISLFNGSGIEQPGMDHIGFKVESVAALQNDILKLASDNPQIAARSVDYNKEAQTRRNLLQKCPLGAVQLADPDGTLIDAADL
ncbi:MAG: VOC family protein [Rhodospirillaceae bacterium]|jgi:predicted enzyme related to lactoylglutathione lyase